MFGNLLSSALRIVTLPIDVANAALDVASGGDGSKRSRKEIPLAGDIEKVRDAASDALKECDE